LDQKEVLIKIAQMGALERYINLTTRELGTILGTSQQSASLYLQKLEADGYIKRIRRNRGTSVTITREGMDLLMGIFNQLRSIFETSREIKIKGHITVGLGEGAYYLSQKQYIDQIREKFGFEPFQGTLNIGLRPKDTPILELLRKGPGIIVEGFTSGGRSFGTCICYPCIVNGSGGVIMVPKRTVHTDIIEMISQVKIRDHLGLNDGDEVDVTITYPAYEDEE
jgi:riboflavin kinase